MVLEYISENLIKIFEDKLPVYIVEPEVPPLAAALGLALTLLGGYIIYKDLESKQNLREDNSLEDYKTDSLNS